MTVLASDGKKPLTGRKVLIALLAAFGVITAVNLTMVTLALSSFTGETQAKSYAMGLDFNRTLASVAAQRARGWQVRGGLESEAPGIARLTASYRDADGRPLDYLGVTARFTRPTSEGHDFDVALKPRGEGLYAADVTLPLSGKWHVRLSADDGTGAPYLLDYRFVAK
jgi:nitrogen fixation protein FixH